MFVGLVNVPKIVLCEVPKTPPVTLPVTTGAAQVYVVFKGTIVYTFGFPLVKTVEKVSKLHIAAVWFGISGFGFTVTVIVNVAPTQFPAIPEVGVTV